MPSSLNARNRLLVALLAVASAASLEAQLLENLQTLSDRLEVGPPRDDLEGRGSEGPKGIATADFDRNGAPDFAVGSTDGTITVYLNSGEAEFGERIVLPSGTSSLRQMITADVTASGYDDIIAAAPHDGVIVIIPNHEGTFGAPTLIPTWRHARNLATGDFNADGRVDIAVAGSRGSPAENAENQGQAEPRGVAIFHGAPGGRLTRGEVIPGRDAGGHTRPVYSLRTRPSRVGDGDELVLTHAWSDRVWILRPSHQSRLEVAATTPLLRTGAADAESFARAEGAYYLDLGPIGAPNTSGIDSLVTVHRNSLSVEIRSPTADGLSFESAPSQILSIPGGPRAARIVDLDSDGWNDLVVVVRNHERVLTYRNVRGRLEPQYESPVGKSPRDLAVADFNGDGEPDIAVINRRSNDVSVLESFPQAAGFESLDLVYLIDADVGDLAIGALSEDGRDDVVQLHRATGEISVRLALPDGRLAPPTFFSMGYVPADLRLADLDADGHLDVATANLGRPGVCSGSLAMRFGDGDGNLGALREFDPGDAGRLFGLEVRDFSGDGILDVAVGYLDCRISFFRGNEDGTFEATGSQFYIYEPRAMCSGDLDNDGDIDLIGASYSGDIVVIENEGDMLDTEPLRSEIYRTSRGIRRTSTVTCVDVDSDGNADILVGNDHGTYLILGTETMAFRPTAQPLEGAQFPVSRLENTDLDGDGDPEIIAACRVFSCLTVLTRGEDGNYGHALTVDVPTAEHIAHGDLDGDGRTDLVGSGDVLWTALSGRRPEPSAPSATDAPRTRSPGPVLNEILAMNSELSLGESGGRTSDFVELYNGSDRDVTLDGWIIVLRGSVPENGPRSFTFGSGVTIGAGDHLLVIFDRRDSLTYPHRADFRIPGSGGTLSLLDRDGDEIDAVTFGPQFPDVSYARYRDGVSGFAFNPAPSPGEPNTDNGTIDPQLEILNFGPDDLAMTEATRMPMPGDPVRIFVRGRDEVGIVNMSVVYRRSDRDPGSIERAILFDDGWHRDDGFQDGLYSGTIPGIDAGVGIEFFVESEDLEGNTTRVPEDASITPDGRSSDVFRLLIGPPPSGLEISELVASNRLGLGDEGGSSADWVEIRNCSSDAVSLDGVMLADSLVDSGDWYRFPDGLRLGPDEHVIVFCDRDTDEGSFHAPFELDAAGDELMLMTTSPSGHAAIVDSVRFGPQASDTALARTGCGGDWVAAEPTPLGVPQTTLVDPGDVDRNGLIEITDAIGILRHLFRGPPVICPAAADANIDSRIDISDAMYVLNFLFLGGPTMSVAQVPCGP